jgi:outer membrane protein assembly factor BamA
MSCCFFSSKAAFVKKIWVAGNTKTQEFVILRELTFKVGDSLSQKDISQKIIASKQNLFNLQLFNNVKIFCVDSTKEDLEFFIDVKERWYFYPIPIMELADRNVNVWWVEKHHDIKRLNVGAIILQRNIRGRNETLAAVLETGFTNYFALQYEFPYIDKKLRQGLQLSSSFYTNKETAYLTYHNKQLFLRDDNHYVKSRFQAGAIWRYRKAIRIRHSIEANYTTYNITDTLLKANPDFLLAKRSFQQFGLLRYLLEIDYRDYKPYPLKGYLINAQATRWGLTPWDNIHMTELSVLASYYIPLGYKFYWYQSLKFKTSEPSAQAYNIQRAMGYLQDYVRGYEYYVIDGQHFGIMRNEVKYCLFKKRFNTGIGERADDLPLNVFIKAYYDCGYVKDQFWSKNNPLNNSFLQGYGIGVDVSTFYDMVARYELTRNALGETKIYIALKANI